MNPFRFPSIPFPFSVPTRRDRLVAWFRRNAKAIVSALIVPGCLMIGAGVLVGIGYLLSSHEDAKPCEAFASYEQQRIPARCLKYWGIDRR